MISQVTLDAPRLVTVADAHATTCRADAVAIDLDCFRRRQPSDLSEAPAGLRVAETSALTTSGDHWVEAAEGWARKSWNAHPIK
jgi:hypothetical protein